ncbi:nicotinamide riboside transporter PnuC [Polymorphobacter fuscus]|uniref:Nicotinamide riboside transporter PnuC n=1 Tax=Sandarakinorhabdus fusca TaxID=1439888 RepID=A0A7C9KJP5_9SPHN|nr:nicotinamide riboside transporter PnuC [Polymorphobacter fuscus]KAB7648443.1 nicotinamide mononucleotide transporter [Polymorphobacter fuscus]MQT15963.1 nicotinamide riboside transporter PnuC [Polymorphobacter fuscus]NJC07760.1 nicotinamide mononucleotide transporter [Polymorphobacter fuscus]
MSPLEATAAALGLVNLVLIARRTIWNYPFGIAMVCLYFVVFWQARLYSAAGLQLFFLASQLYGWWYWRKVTDGSSPVPVRRLATSGRLVALGAGMVITVGLGLVMTRLTDAAAPWWDAGNAGFSMVAQILTDRRHVESWPLWIGINILSVWLYASQGLLATAGLYAVFLCIAAWGWDSWRRVAA